MASMFISPETIAETRGMLKKQPAYLAGQSFDTAPQYLKDLNQKNVFMLRASGFNPDPGPKFKNAQDKLGWKNTHMIFTITSINDKEKIVNKRYILGVAGDVTELEVPEGEWTQTKGTLTDRTWKSLDALIEDWAKNGITPWYPKRNCTGTLHELQCMKRRTSRMEAKM